ncbi:death-on-curing protein [Candidatus Nomurabacteria bacterium RIFCSPHIGHO2_01_FULL_37_25]|uniref:Death-on-curing protein n=1 Tax=Candidatus Nomurabacteria bacterium RIFCSPLOWO2_01_FULL_36_16 TaxID=1801767 RepID=A0A1F6WZM0_9BACT|nr:MAG: death-on-curing protein [Candidatus Nomurabacteria bacterium RIFCSPHIGHO2_01_FULL_37_25]OGI75511.1 MAG: death-on-curing protein [Candidatus Nomurabacteria bacterium RIFCSPHIGHO2_02_FULL_36_29]OGI87349.1 MAG: death-on-curing protein [Candidatus Nomurabacteria bacterium RIFCSPLOWO2_01_FULL_36_16]OGI94897.1 MAG: death-on-curing protein [Candidatus Nomurabacteria bacterium RIFCSPLOWO2_02_FULL_36_8]
MKKKIIQNNIVIYQAKNGAIELRGDFKKETIWATQAQIAKAFQTDRSVVTKHIKNILKDREIDGKSNVQKMHITNSDKPVNVYSLDIILAVGYRTNSKRAMEFRKWATKIIREHIVKGYTINRKQIGNNYDAFMKSVGDIQMLLPEHITLDPKAVIELIKEFSSTWVSLDAYDKETLSPIGVNKKSIKLNGEELMNGILNLRKELMKTGDMTDIFAQERKKGSVEGIVGNVMQAFDGNPVYKTIEEKAAHLLYFMVKNHPFIDGNKRSGAFAFIWFLKKTRIKTIRKINPNALTALTLLIAESNPNKKDLMVSLITQMLK